jgi:pteridine reductase
MQEYNKTKTALITGGAKRIGREIALYLAKNGYNIVISYNNSSKDAEKLAIEVENLFQKKCHTYKCDLCDIRQTQKLANYMASNFLDWNLLINNASIFEQNSFIQDDFLTKFEKNQNIHLTSPIILGQTFAKQIASRKTIDAQFINMVDKNITRFDSKYFYYTLSKKSLANLTQMLALELSPNIRSNAIAPGIILPPIDNHPYSHKNNPLQYEASPVNIVQAVNYLLTNKFVNGEILYVDGGSNLNNQG